MNAEQLTTLVNAALEDIKAQNVVTLDVFGMTSIADRIIVASGNSSRHVKSIADAVIERAKENGVKPLGIEGDAQSDWVLVDLGDVIVHVMTPATRQYYDLERLWSMNVKPVEKRSDEA
jgi:ribosome-associated protein